MNTNWSCFFMYNWLGLVLKTKTIDRLEINLTENPEQNRQLLFTMYHQYTFFKTDDIFARQVLVISINDSALSYYRIKRCHLCQCKKTNETSPNRCPLHAGQKCSAIIFIIIEYRKLCLRSGSDYHLGQLKLWTLLRNYLQKLIENSYFDSNV